ncbi:MAG: hypothetical protein DRJ40_10940 [Thermoprotei archaeon]|nr:MAG: hypothetical protein DRJ40_10940 [Thermoprotei archaeon]
MTKQVNVKLSDDMYKLLENLARVRRISIPALIRELIRQALQQKLVNVVTLGEQKELREVQLAIMDVKRQIMDIVKKLEELSSVVTALAQQLQQPAVVTSTIPRPVQTGEESIRWVLDNPWIEILSRRKITEVKEQRVVT